ncbi:lipid-A-disaccharide synthase [Xanthomonas arboricola pv. corylina]|uniref:Lipid-A-disaccharide synthase n=1 Tax=Xanthomonas arboricola pv. corylina TaxID=487821 RepID=A0A2S7CHQ1_9XANT|nr:lipid-A-disaccharide synthase [Xanthomonas arboricola]MDN0202190.1 lipid-A-disaccharide synthase [Xanthomonas arboricola pv. corylina]MDN0206776.1 lipid-A-disaccharide synthase [Xanthomonas arboricola pv. corylina]MDN0210931.1 lipid-A-disaccharide synthase [Xanthomonas arboricola pv. corylina]MDN0214292.1 lipid-A-disaccharide synthase [Xanthomonas arboricola pv. corylina]PPU15142.1 lipid-A-disaccharide synthase [Xanthomonas arboricola pv. corylina]
MTGIGNRESGIDSGAHADAPAAGPSPALPIPHSPLPIPSAQTRAPRIALIAGEASGDILGAGLIEQLRRRYPGAEFVGIGGDAMRGAGCQTWFDASELAVMGLTEVLQHLPRLLKLRRAFRERVLAWKPDVFIGIDAPDFNLSVERWLKQRGVRTVHYVSPSVWAWREKRAEKIGASADLVLCLFPMEPPIYARHGIDARFVGHPMADDIAYQADRAAARAKLGLSASSTVLAVLPGSRHGEISKLGDTFFQAAWLVSEHLPNLHVLVPAANPGCKQLLAEQLSRSSLPVLRSHLLDGQARTAMLAADVVLLASGTATLEAMLVKRPMVVGYKVAPLTYRIVRTLGLLKVNRYALPNILANDDLAPELMQDDCTPERLCVALLDWFKHPEKVAALQPRYLALHAELRRDASARAADAVAGLLMKPESGIGNRESAGAGS